MKDFKPIDYTIIILVMIFVIFLCGAFFHLGIRYGRNNSLEEKESKREKTTITKKNKITTARTTNGVYSNFVKNEVLITFRDKVDEETRKEIINSLPNLNNYTESYDLYVAELKKDFRTLSDLKDYCKKLTNNYTEIQYCEPNYIITIPDCNKGPC